jgi:hypothetical protein
LVFRNFISAVLLLVAILGIINQVSSVRSGTITLSDARVQLIAYSLIAVYAFVSLIIRMRPQRKP